MVSGELQARAGAVKEARIDGGGGLGAWRESWEPVSGPLFSSGTVIKVQLPTGKFRFKGTRRGRGARRERRDSVLERSLSLWFDMVSDS